MLVVLAGCGGDGERAQQQPARAVGEARVGNVGALAMCRDWRRGTTEQRLATIRDIRAQITLKGTPTPTPDLTDAQARQVFDRACADSYAAGFRLYKLYARAAAFQAIPAGDR